MVEGKNQFRISYAHNIVAYKLIHTCEHMDIYIHTCNFLSRNNQELIYYLPEDAPLLYKEIQVWAFEWKSKSSDNRRKGQVFAELPQQSSTKKRQHVEYKQLNFFPQTMTIKRVFLFYQGDTPSHLPPACRNQANSSLSQVITTAQMCVPHANALISFKVCFVGSHWCHSKEPVTRGLKSFTTNCMIKLLKHACPLLILFYSTSLSEKNCCAAQCLIYISFGEEEVKGLKLRIKTLTLHCIFFSFSQMASWLPWLLFTGP